MAEVFTTPPGIISWPTLFVPRPVVPGAEPRFSCTLILDKKAQEHENWKKIRRAVAKCIDDRWGAGKSRDQNFVRSLRMPWQPCSVKSHLAGFEDPQGVYINPWSKQQPKVFDRRVSLITDPADVWAGQTAIFSLVVWPYQQSANKGVGMCLNNVQIVRMDGQRLDGRSSNGSEFTPLDDDDGAFTPMMATHEEDPF